MGELNEEFSTYHHNWYHHTKQHKYPCTTTRTTHYYTKSNYYNLFAGA